MTMKPILGLGRLLLVLLLLSLPRLVSAQTASVSGLVTDATGAVLPGVTVEAASEALIERVRTAVTDGSGRYEVLPLQPGIYKVSFRLAGFQTLVRDNIRVLADTSVPINIQMAVGQLEETVTVTGQSPVVDVQQATTRTVLDRQVLDELPTARTTHLAGMIIPGLKVTGQMVGGANNALAQQYVTVRGKGISQNTTTVDGLDTRFSGGNEAYDNYAMAQEVTVDTNPTSAEIRGSGVRTNMIPREGGNIFKGDLYVSGLNGSWQANNLTDALRAGGPTELGRRSAVQTPTATEWVYDVNPAQGGPILRNRLWYFASARINHTKQAPSDATYFEVNPATGRVQPGSRQGYNNASTDNLSFRLTWQLGSKNKIATYYDRFWRYQSHLGGTRQTDWATVPTVYPKAKQMIWPTKWTMTATNRLLVEAGYSYYGYNQPTFEPQPGNAKEPFTPAWYASASKNDSATGLTWDGPSSSLLANIQPYHNFSGSTTYVTGSHSFKAGIQGRLFTNEQTSLGSNAHLQQRYVNSVPNAVSVSAVPGTNKGESTDVWVYAQDRWTFKRLTINPGIRFEHFEAAVSDASLPAGRFVPARTVTGFPVYSFNNVLPRFSAVYDVFGNAKTAVKFSAGKFQADLSAGSVGSYSPISSVGEVRNWFDCDINPVTRQCTGLNPFGTNGDNIAQDNEIPASTNPRFGQAASLLLPEPGALSRESIWDYSVSLQQELWPGVAVTGAWYYSREGDLWATRAVGITPDDYTSFTIQNPLNSSDTITVFNLKPGIATGTNAVRSSSIDKRIYHGFEASVQARLKNGGTIVGGWYADRKQTVTCDTNNPNGFRFCDTTAETFQEYGKVQPIPFLHEFKLAGTYPLPLGFIAAASFISYAGSSTVGQNTDSSARWQTVSYDVPANLFPGGRTTPVSVQLLYPSQVRLDRWNQLDLKFSRTFRFGGIETRPQVEIYNLNNSSVIAGESLSYSTALGLVQTPTQVLPGRMLRLGMMIRF